MRPSFTEGQHLINPPVSVQRAASTFQRTGFDEGQGELGLLYSRCSRPETHDGGRVTCPVPAAKGEGGVYGNFATSSGLMYIKCFFLGVGETGKMAL